MTTFVRGASNDHWGRLMCTPYNKMPPLGTPVLERFWQANWERGGEPTFEAIRQKSMSGGMLVGGYQCRIFFIENTICALFHWFQKVTPQENRHFFGGGATRKRTSQETPLQTRQDTRRNPRHKRGL